MLKQREDRCGSRWRSGVGLSVSKYMYRLGPGSWGIPLVLDMEWPRIEKEGRNRGRKERGRGGRYLPWPLGKERT